MKGAEALIRWDSPELGFVLPGKFIDIFEHTGFIINIDNYMLTHVARDQKRWYDMGLPCVPVSVNVSRAHFVESDLADQINKIVTGAGFFSEVEEEGRGQIVVSEAIKLAKNLNMRTVAEGVEQREQVDFLADEGCDGIQGYFLGRPAPIATYAGLVGHDQTPRADIAERRAG